MADRPTLQQLSEWVNYEKRDELVAADLTGMDLTGAQLWGGDLSGLNLQDCDFTRANLFGSDLREANLRGADLSTADLHKTNLRGAVYNDETRLPHEFPAEDRWMIHERDIPDPDAND